MDSKSIALSLRDVQSNIYKGQFEPALSSLASILSATPDHIEALYMKAVCLRYKGEHTDSFAVLQKIKVLEPEFGRAFQEEGHLYLAGSKKEQAISAFRLACNCNPALEASWRKLSELLSSNGAHEEAKQAKAQADRLTALPRELLAVSNFIHEGNLLKAEALCRRFLKANPHHIEAMRLLADLGARLGSLEEADFLLESALTFDPTNVQVRLDHIAVLRKRQNFEAALKQAKHLLGQDPENPVFLSHYAIECLQANLLDEALETFNHVLKKLPNDPATLTSKGHVLKTIGHHDDAVDSYRSAYASSSLYADAYHALANLKTYQFTDTELQSMLSAEDSRDLNYSSRIQFCFALGKAYEDRKDYEQSFTYYKRGNDLKLKQCRYSADQMDEEFAALAKSCSKELFERNYGTGHQASDPIFIVGLPRAGSTLLEQILASHSQVDGTLELPNIIALAHKLRAGYKID
ncbi:MAG: tetratricopeptide repeat protein, partial [Kordiimonas sp.]